MQKKIPEYVTLNNGQKMPTLGLGTYKIDQHNTGVDVIYKAITEQGIRHIDTASRYKTAKHVGEAIKKAMKDGIKREDLFVVTKLWLDEKNNAEYALKKQLEELQLDYVDCYLIHWPFQYYFKNKKAHVEKLPLHVLWKILENCVKKGLTKSIGVSNFNCQILIDLLTYCEIKPVCNQIELHPYNSQYELVEWLKKVDIQPVGYASLGAIQRSRDKKQDIIIEHQLIKELAKKYDKTTTQIILNWGICRGHVVLAKSTNLKRIQQNLESQNFKLEQNDIEKINKINKDLRYFDVDNIDFPIKCPIFK